MDAKTRIKRHEGVRLNAYKDSLGIWTIGVGFNLERQGANDALKKHGINPDMIWAAIEEARKAGRKSTAPLINDAQVDALLEDDVRDCLTDLRQLVPGFDAYPQSAQEVLADMRFQLGPARLRAFKNTVKAFQDRRWKDATAGMRASLAYKQTPERWEENAKAIESLA